MAHHTSSLEAMTIEMVDIIPVEFLRATLEVDLPPSFHKNIWN